MHDHAEALTAEQVLGKMTAEMGKTPEVMELLSKPKPSMVVEQARFGISHPTLEVECSSGGWAEGLYDVAIPDARESQVCPTLAPGLRS